MLVIGKTLWAIAEGYIPSASTSEERALVSHEAACLLNAGGRRRERQDHAVLRRSRAGRSVPRQGAGPPDAASALQRPRRPRAGAARHRLRFSVIERDVPIVVQHTRLDLRRAELALLTTIAFAQE